MNTGVRIFGSRRSALSIFVCSFVCLSVSPGQTAKKYWVYFTDKGPAVPTAGSLLKASTEYAAALKLLSPKALARRAKVLPPESVVTVEDAPVFHPYLEDIVGAGGMPVEQSRWLNAASVVLTPEQIGKVAALPFVEKVMPVVVFRGSNKERESIPQPNALFKTSSLNYGPSATQVQIIHVPELHDFGVTGHDVVVGMLDTGFRWRVHESLKTRHVLAEHDFIFNDDTTANQPGDGPSQDQHGTLTMSTLGGYMPGQLIGPAFDADFILAKTEYIPTETRIEEDHWQAGIEWMESLGVDVVSSSLGYNTFDPPGGGYTWANGDFDGKTSVTAKAAARAARLGIVVCDAMGNEGNGDGTVGTMLTPADADSIISVGAVNFAKQLAYFSSTGPTNDGRTKPDVVSPGMGVYCASTAGPGSYFYIQGTSLATPLTAGSVALMLSARPELTPIQVRDALRNTAEPLVDTLLYPTSPNNFAGWGFINTLSAVLSFGPVFSNRPSVPVVDTTTLVEINVASKFGIDPGRVILHYAIGPSSVYYALPMILDSSMLFATSGRYRVALPRESLGTLVKFSVTALDSSSNYYASPAPISGKIWQLHYGIAGVQPVPLLPTTYGLLQNYPNPFNPSTKITYDLPGKEHVSVRVYNVLGELVATLVDEVQEAGSAKSRPPLLFDGSNLPSGVYFYRIITPSFVSTKKMMLLR